MAAGVDKLVLLRCSIKRSFQQLARKKGMRKWGYRHVIDLRAEDEKLPIRLYCDGIHTGIDKIEFIDVADFGLRRTLEHLKVVADNPSAAKIYRIDCCVDIWDVAAWDLARIGFMSGSQNFKLYKCRGAVSLYLQHSKNKKILLYDKARELKAHRSPSALVLPPGVELTRIEVQLSGPDVPFRRIYDISRYAEVNLLDGVKFGRLRSTSDGKRLLHSMAAAHFIGECEKFGLHATLKQYPSSHRAYLQKLFVEEVKDNEVPDIGRLLRKAIEDWLEGRVRFPRL